MDSKQDGHRTPRACGWSAERDCGHPGPKRRFPRCSQKHLCFPSHRHLAAGAVAGVQRAQVLTCFIAAGNRCTRCVRRRLRSAAHRVPRVCRELRRGNQEPTIPHFPYPEFPSLAPGLRLALSTEVTRVTSCPGACLQMPSPCWHLCAWLRGPALCTASSGPPRSRVPASEPWQQKHACSFFAQKSGGTMPRKDLEVCPTVLEPDPQRGARAAWPGPGDPRL